MPEQNYYLVVRCGTKEKIYVNWVNYSNKLIAYTSEDNLRIITPELRFVDFLLDNDDNYDNIIEVVEDQFDRQYYRGCLNTSPTFYVWWGPFQLRSP